MWQRAPGKSSDGDGHTKVILVCNDERHIVRLLQVNLVRQGNRVLVALDGESCLRSLEAEQPDWLVLDGLLPGKTDAFGVLAALRATPDCSVQVALMLAAGQNASDFEYLLREGDIILNKPLDPTGLA